MYKLAINKPYAVNFERRSLLRHRRRAKHHVTQLLYITRKLLPTLTANIHKYVQSDKTIAATIVEQCST